MAEAALTLEAATGLASQLRENVGRSIFGQEELITETLCCFLSGGHILMTGAPGLAKTTLVRVFSRYLKLSFGRIQFTPDLLPSDIVGSDILNVDGQTGKRSFEFAKGPIFTNLLLADEINRASPRTQSALLEAMQERRVTVGGSVYGLPLPFMVFATQNPFESEGTYPLPEAQLDRFLLHTLVDYPDERAEDLILRAHAKRTLVGEQTGPSDQPTEDAVGVETVTALIERARQIEVDEAIIYGIRDLVRSTRPQDELCPESLRGNLWYGAGPRAGISLISVCQALALIEQQEQVRWAHVKRLAKPVLRHRIRLTSQATREGLNEDLVIDDLLGRLESRQKNLSRGIA